MMLPGDSPPPFIHPQLGTETARDGRTIYQSLPRPLASCAAIMQMCSVKNEGNVLFIWRAIRMEQERFSLEYIDYDDVDLVAALQAISIYILLRLSETNEEATNFDVPLTHTMLNVALLADQRIFRYGTLSDGRIPPWKDWILAESLRRSIILLFLVNLFFDILSSLPYDDCDAGSWLLDMALPSVRNLWKASSSVEWERKYIARSNDLSAGKELKYCDLLNSRARAGGALDSWLSQLDDFGTLVMAAASLTD
ncbi:hypothetical protein MMC10_007961 [Thelotrema lepadinum]|nr:hypothetical protein [Thelotrema lepadinum]